MATHHTAKPWRGLARTAGIRGIIARLKARNKKDIQTGEKMNTKPKDLYSKSEIMSLLKDISTPTPSEEETAARCAPREEASQGANQTAPMRFALAGIEAFIDALISDQKGHDARELLTVAVGRSVLGEMLKDLASGRAPEGLENAIMSALTPPRDDR